MQSKRVNEVDIAKGIGILLVVLGHAVPDANTGIKNPIVFYVFTWIYSFHMALFMSVAGFVFYRKYRQYKTVPVSAICNKFQRLMVPYLFYSILFLFGARSLCFQYLVENL